MNSSQLRKKYLEFFKQRKHRIIPAAALIPVNDPTTLFTSSGMQPLVPFLMGEKHPLGQRLVNSQTCFRAEDIDEVGDNRHTTFFEMLGNWSLGDYFKREQLPWIWEFFTKVVKLPKNKLAVSISAGGLGIKKDTGSESIWLKLGVPKDRIFAYPIEEENWWSRAGSPEKMPPGEIGGQDSEIFYEFTQIKHDSKFGKECHPNCDCGRFLEIGNSVFMEYQKDKQGQFKKLPQQNVDFGGGLERILAAKDNCPDIFQTDLFKPIIKAVEKVSGQEYQGNEKAMRITTDHLKAACFMVQAGVRPSNKLQGYVLRRLLRRAMVKMHRLRGGLKSSLDLRPILKAVMEIYQDIYFKNPVELEKETAQIVAEEMKKFSRTLEQGLKEIKKTKPEEINAQLAFNLFQTYGFPFEITQEIVAEKGLKLESDKFNQLLAKHQQLSRQTSQGIFKGGLANHSAKTVKLHTATHLLHAALRQVLGRQVRQVGSNITEKRLRFDFTHPRALTEREIKQVEALVNQKIKANLPIKQETMTFQEAKKKGALAFFGQKYPQKVKVYKIGQSKKKAFSFEVCAGPHLSFTGGLGKFRIEKETSCGAGKRRIYGVLK